MVQQAQRAPDRLPWLAEVPKSEPPPPPREARRFAWPWPWLAGLAALAAVAGLAYWLGTKRAASPEPAIEQAPVTAVPDSPPAQEEIGNIPSVSDMKKVEEVAVQPVPVIVQVPAAAQPAPPAIVDPPAARTAPNRSATRPRRRPRTAAAAPPVEIPDQPVVRGRIIQIGAYPTRERADEAWKYVVKRWPYLATKPKLISPIEVQSSDGKATTMYRLQLATTTQAQSAVICQQLEKAKTSCVVVY